jgi:hypothetical protein
MLIENTGKINNGGGEAIDGAVANGYSEGTQVVGVRELSHIVSNFELYPNPAKNEANINISLSNEANVSLSIVDISGKIVKSKEYGQLNGTYILPIGLEGLESGIYFVNLWIGNESITQKLIVQ